MATKHSAVGMNRPSQQNFVTGQPEQVFTLVRVEGTVHDVKVPCQKCGTTMYVRLPGVIGRAVGEECKQCHASHTIEYDFRDAIEMGLG